MSSFVIHRAYSEQVIKISVTEKCVCNYSNFSPGPMSLMWIQLHSKRKWLAMLGKYEWESNIMFVMHCLQSIFDV